MTFEQKIKSEKNWHKKVLLIRIFHHTMLSRDSNWTLRKSAKSLDLSLGNICESLKLGELYDEIKDCKNRREALIFMKNIK